MRVIFALIVLALAANTAQAQDLTTDKGKLSYAYGWQVGQTIMSRGEEFDTEAIISAIRASAAENDPQLPAEEMAAELRAFQEKVRLRISAVIFR